MTLREILNQAAEGFNLMKSVERVEADLVFATPEDANRFVNWAATRNIATQDTFGKTKVTVFLDGRL